MNHEEDCAKTSSKSDDENRLLPKRRNSKAVQTIDRVQIIMWIVINSVFLIKKHALYLIDVENICLIDR